VTATACNNIDLRPNPSAVSCRLRTLRPRKPAARQSHIAAGLGLIEGIT
jgi:hypothetical protein